jgi:hypothetical protein
MENNGTSPHLWMIFPAINLHFISHRIPAVNHPKVRTPTSTCLGFSYGEIMENPWIVVEKWWNIVINCDKDDGILMFFFPVLKSETYPVPVCFFEDPSISWKFECRTALQRSGMMMSEPAHGITKSVVLLDWPQVLFFEECSECSIKFQRKAQVMIYYCFTHIIPYYTQYQ